jgi:PKD repeat protein
MKKIFIFLLLLSPLLTISQVTKFYLNSTTTAYETIIAFSDSTSDGLDICCDAVSFGNFSPIWTSIGQQQYVINSFSKLDNDKFIPLGIRCPSETFEIGINQVIGDTIQCMIWDSMTGQLYDLPHQFSTPTNGDTRFKIFFERPLEIIINDFCDNTQVIIDDDTTIGYYTLTHNGIVQSVESDTIYIDSNGSYQLELTGDTIYEQVTFNIQNINSDYNASLIVPLTEVPVYDAVIVPVLQLNYTPYEIIWDFGDGSIIYNDINPVHEYNQPGVYNLLVTIISQNGCILNLNSIITVYSINGILPVKATSKGYPYFYDLSGRLIKK